MTPIRIRRKRKEDRTTDRAPRHETGPLSAAIPVVALRGMTVFPHMSVHFDVARSRTVKALEHAMNVSVDQRVLLVAQKSAATEEPEAADLYAIGVLGKVRQIMAISKDVLRVVVEGERRARITEMLQSAPFAMAQVELPEIPAADPLASEAVLRAVMEVYERFTQLSGKVSPEAIAVASIADPGHAADVIGGHVLEKLEDRQALLEELDPVARATRLLSILERENEVLAVEKNLRESVHQQMTTNQREYYLKEQLRAISKELGEDNEADALRERVAALPLPDASRKAVAREMDRLANLSPQSPETSVVRSWVDLICDLPWDHQTEDLLDLAHARAVLDRDHHGLDRVKDRICEYLAVLRLKKEMKGPILCFVGPPGVGKTSVARSVATALGRKFIRMSLGGVRDEAEIRGHRRTYIGAMPGRIIAGLRTAESRNPVVLLDEIDKLASDFRGDPSSALLEALDSEQNHAFSDHYLEIPFDLSQVMFLTTANTLDTIPAALRDRLEIIEISGYTEDEKLRIARDHLLPKQTEAHGIGKGRLILRDEAILGIIRRYTREAGVRALERSLARICRKAAVRVASGEVGRMMVGARALETLLGKPRYRYGSAEASPQVGIAVGLAWTGSGGDVLPVEAACLPGNGTLQLTGSLGDVMKESAHAAYTWIRAHAADLSIETDFAKTDIHIHVPEGAVPKDGPSAGITLCTAMVSALSGVPVRQDLAMTGEITLRGRVLPIGGLKEKLLAARRAGMATVLIPRDNRRDLDEIGAAVSGDMKVIPIAEVREVLARALRKGG